MAFERIRAIAGWGGQEERYPDDSDFTPPEQVEDPHTIEDSTQESALDRLLANRWWALSVALLSFAGLILVLIYFGRYFATVLANPWVQRIVVAVALFAGGRRTGRQSEREQFESEHELTLYNPRKETSTHFRGRFEAVKGATHNVFVPFKGRRRNSGEPYKVGELSKSLVDKYNQNPKEEARIRLHPTVSTVEPTEYGIKVTQLTAGSETGDSAVEPDPFGTETNLDAPLPDLASTETVSELKGTIEELEEEKRNLSNRIDQFKRQRDNALELAGKNFDEVRGFIESDAEIFQGFVRRQGGQSSDSGSDDDSLSGADKAKRLANPDD